MRRARKNRFEKFSDRAHETALTGDKEQPERVPAAVPRNYRTRNRFDRFPKGELFRRNLFGVIYKLPIRRRMCDEATRIIVFGILYRQILDILCNTLVHAAAVFLFCDELPVLHFDERMNL